ncbi:Phage protein [Lactococcus sp. DD01]|nr:Phage protein [Lactococcus sp. DD01]
MTKADYSDIIKKNEAVAKHRKFITTKNGKIRGFLQEDIILLSTSESGFKMNKLGFPVKMTVSNGFVERCQVKQEIKRVHKSLSAPEGVRLLSELVEKDIREIKPNSPWDEWHRFWAYENIYQIAFNRGVRQERQRKKQRDNIGALTGNDMHELAQALSIDINKLNTAVLELTSKQKGGVA